MTRPSFIQCLVAIPLLLSGLSLHAQEEKAACTALSTGIYYSYPKNTHTRYSFLRDASIEKEFNLDTGDSTVWQIQWQDDCSYTMKFLSGNEKLTQGQRDFLAKHQVAFKVELITGDYYVYSAFVDKVSKLFLQRDTVWLHEKLRLTPAGNALVSFIPSEANLRKKHFSDTSRYAVIYLYRPGKLTNSFSSFPIFCNDSLLWMAKNKTGCLIKVMKEGEMELKSRLLKDQSAVKIDVHFGHVYYIKAMVHWGISARLYNFKLEMAAVGPDQGTTEFAEVAVE